MRHWIVHTQVLYVNMYSLALLVVWQMYLSRDSWSLKLCCTKFKTVLPLLSLFCRDVCRVMSTYIMMSNELNRTYVKYVIIISDKWTTDALTYCKISIRIYPMYVNVWPNWFFFLVLRTMSNDWIKHVHIEFALQLLIV